MISLEREGLVGQILLHRAPANAYNRGFTQELDEAVEAVRGDDAIHAVVLSSTLPRFFSAGADVKFFQASTMPEKEKFILHAPDSVAAQERFKAGLVDNLKPSIEAFLQAFQNTTTA